MLEDNILKECEIVQSINQKLNNIVYKFIETKPTERCEKIEPHTLLDYQQEILQTLDEIWKNINILTEAIGD